MVGKWLPTIIDCLEAIKQHVAFALVDDSDICCYVSPIQVAPAWWLAYTQLTNIMMTLYRILFTHKKVHGIGICTSAANKLGLWSDRVKPRPHDFDDCSRRKRRQFVAVFTARCTLLQSAVLRLHVVRPSQSVRLSVCLFVTLVNQYNIGWKAWKLMARTISPTRTVALRKFFQYPLP